MTKVQTEKWIMSSKVVPVKKDEVLYKKDSLFDHVLIIIEGSAMDITNNKEYKKGAIFGIEYCYPKIQTRKKAFCG